MDEMKSMFIKGGLKRLSSPTCRVPALDSARVNWPLTCLSPAKRTDIDARVTISLVYLNGRLVQLHLQAEHRQRRTNIAADLEGGKANRSTGRRTVERLRLSDRTAHV